MTRTVAIATGARLHFGPLSYHPVAGRHFGGVGLMVQQPGFQINFAEAAQDQIVGDAFLHERVRQFVDGIRQRTADECQPPPCSIDVMESIPAHAGLGSGTQLGLAIARGLAELAGEQGTPIDVLATRAGRGRRSAVGLYGFAAGGLIVDAGKFEEQRLGALACQLPVPAAWRVLLLTPQRARAGFSGKLEEQAFERLGPMPMSLTDHLCRLVVTELLPAAGSADFDRFGEAVFDYGHAVGEFFAAAQGGEFGGGQSNELVARLRRWGVRGIGQSSWGPTLFAFAASSDHARDLMGRLRTDLPASLPIRSVTLAAPLNAGAEVTGADQTA